MITTGQGTRFESRLIKALTNLLDVKCIHPSNYRPQANGVMENWHGIFKPALNPYLSQRWTENLPKVLLGLRAMF